MPPGCGPARTRRREGTRIAAGQRAAALNQRTRALAADHPRLVVVPFPTELTERLWVPQSRELRYTRTYEVWSRQVLTTLRETSVD